VGGTPASDAGVTEGARIVAIDGAALSPNDADRVRKILSGAPGTLVRVLFAGGVTRQFVLRAYL
jgi:C-terminal processing protease CtpA/Prc